MSSMLELNGIRAGYGRLTVLFDLDLTVEAGEWVTVLGANGAGRSTLLKTILGATTVSAGEVHFLGSRITHDSPSKRVAAGITMSPEGRRILPSLSVRDNLVAGASGVRSRDIESQLEQVYDVFPKLDQRSDQRAGSLSGGEQQMLAIGRALMSRPQLLLVDEVSLGLAPIVVQSLYASLKGLSELGLAVIAVDQAHMQESVAEFSHRELLLEKGRFVSKAAWDEDITVIAGTS